MKKPAHLACLVLLLASCSNAPTAIPATNGLPNQQQKEETMQSVQGADSTDIAAFMNLSGFNIYKLKIPSSFSGDSLTVCVKQYYQGKLVDSSAISDQISLFSSHNWLRAYTRHVSPQVGQFYVAERAIAFDTGF